MACLCRQRRAVSGSYFVQWVLDYKILTARSANIVIVEIAAISWGNRAQEIVVGGEGRAATKLLGRVAELSNLSNVRHPLRSEEQHKTPPGGK